MATVGNLFVNVRGRTSGLVRDMKKANRSVTKDFYRNQAMATQNWVNARERVADMTNASTPRFQRAMANLRTMEGRRDIARIRPERLAQRRELMGRKARGESMRAMMAREAKMMIPLVLGVPAATLAFAVRKGVKSFESATQFAVAGPSGGAFVQAKIGKVLDDLAFAQRPDASRTMARAAQLERETAILWREVGLQFQIVMNLILEQFGLSITPPAIAGDEGFVAGGNREQMLASERERKQFMRSRQVKSEADQFWREALWMFD